MWSESEELDDGDADKGGKAAASADWPPCAKRLTRCCSFSFDAQYAGYVNTTHSLPVLDIEEPL